VLPSGNAPVDRLQRAHHLIGGNAEALGEAATARQDVLRVPVAGERALEVRIQFRERCPLIDRVPVAHHQHDLPARRGHLTPAAILRRPAHLEDAMRLPVDRVQRCRLSAHSALPSEHSSPLYGTRRRGEDLAPTVALTSATCRNRLLDCAQ